MTCRDPAVTVVTVCRNAADVIERTLRSVVEQDLPGLEYIVVDGDSTDGTLEVLERYRARIDRLISEPDRGIADAFNKGIAHSHGQWLLMLNAGDAFTGPGSLRTLLSGVQEGVTIVVGRARFGTITVPRWPLWNHGPLMMKAYPPHQATLVHRGVHARHGVYDDSYRVRMDFDFFLRVLRHERLATVDRVVVDYLPGGLSGREPRLFWAEGRRAMAHNRAGPASWILHEALYLQTVVRSFLRDRAAASVRPPQDG